MRPYPVALQVVARSNMFGRDRRNLSVENGNDQSSEPVQSVLGHVDDDLVPAIKRGYETDAYFADEANTAKLTLRNGMHYNGDVIVIPDVRVIKVRILKGLHDAAYAGHVGGRRTVKNVARVYWWPGMYNEICEYVKGCEVCQRNKGSQRQPAGKLVPLPVLEGAWDKVTADRITHLKRQSLGTLPFGLLLIA